MPQLTASAIAAKFSAARSILASATIEIRYRSKTFNGVSVPIVKEEVVDDAGAMRMIEAGARVLVSELGPEWPKMNEIIEIKSRETGRWENRMVVSPTIDEAGATMLLMWSQDEDPTY